MNLILFNVSGTLVRTSDFEHKVLLQTLSSVLGLPLKKLRDFTKAETETVFVEKVWRLIKGVEPSAEEWETVYSTYRNTLMKAYLESNFRFQAIDGAPDLLSHLQISKSWAFAIATTAWHDMAHFSLRGSGFYTRRFHVVTGEGVSKKTELMQKAINSSKRWYGAENFTKVTYVGDEHLDANVCRELNIPMLQVCDLQGEVEATPGVPVYPDKGRFIRLARRAVVPPRVRQHSLGSLIGIRI